jgi:hypothetical protein
MPDESLKIPFKRPDAHLKIPYFKPFPEDFRAPPCVLRRP